MRKDEFFFIEIYDLVNYIFCFIEPGMIISFGLQIFIKANKF